MKQLIIGLILIATLLSCSSKSRLTTEINNIVSEKQLTLGIAVFDSQDGVISTINPDENFPMQSVYKFHIALSMLNQVDRDIFSLSDSITITKSQLLENTWSPFRDEHTNGRTATLAELIEYILIKSDNNISDVILEMVGGTKAVQGYLDSIGVDNTNICNYERELKADWNLQYLNYTTPISAVELLRKFRKNELLESDTHNFLWDAMSKTYTGSIRDSLPEGTTVAHKSGFSGVGKNGIVAANNDIGIMTLPNGREIIYSIFISESKESSEDTYKIISQVASTIYNFYN